MARHDRLQVLRAILDGGVVASFQHDEAETAEGIARALAAGGVRVIELLNRGEQDLEVFRALAAALERDAPDVVLGVGSIVDAPTAALFLAHGAEFVVAPGLNPAIVRQCNRRKVACLPGCATVSEISKAEELGCEIVKLFPSSAMNGLEFVRSLLGPMPWSRVMPTGNGVAFAEASIREWLAAGACALGLGAALVDPKLVAAGDFTALTRRAEQLRGWIAAARRPGARAAGETAR